MLKFRIEFQSSRLLLTFQLVTYAVLVLSVLNWQSNIIQYQVLLQIVVVVIVTFFAFKAILHSRQKQIPVIFSQSGEWLETNINGQVGWKITNKSRVSSFLLFIHLISPLNSRHSKWCLIYKDQVTERNYRRLCRAVHYQQQNVGKIDI